MQQRIFTGWPRRAATALSTLRRGAISTAGQGPANAQMADRRGWCGAGRGRESPPRSLLPNKKLQVFQLG